MNLVFIFSSIIQLIKDSVITESVRLEETIVGYLVQHPGSSRVFLEHMAQDSIQMQILPIKIRT